MKTKILTINKDLKNAKSKISLNNNKVQISKGVSVTCINMAGSLKGPKPGLLSRRYSSLADIRCEKERKNGIIKLQKDVEL